MRRESAAGGSRVVLEHLQALTNGDCTGAVPGVLDPDLGQAVIHRPLEAVRGVLHLHLDDIEQSCKVEALGVLRYPFRGQRPAGTRDHRIRVGGPGQTQLFGVQVLLHHVIHKPVVHLRYARRSQHAVQLVPFERLRAADQNRQQSRRGVFGLPELARELLLRFQPLRDRAQFAEIHTVIVTVSLVHLASLRILELRPARPSLRPASPRSLSPQPPVRQVRQVRPVRPVRDSAYDGNGPPVVHAARRQDPTGAMLQTSKLEAACPVPPAWRARKIFSALESSGFARRLPSLRR